MGALRFQIGLEQPKVGAVSERVQNAEAGKGSQHVSGGPVQVDHRSSQAPAATISPLRACWPHFHVGLDTDGGETVRNWGTF